MVYPTDEETFPARNTPEWIREGHLNSIQSLLKRIQDFLGYGGRLHDETGLVFPVGGIIGYGGVTAPAGWLLCDGKEYDKNPAAYSDLFAVIGTNFGQRAGNLFNVPDYRGICIRGYSKLPTISFVPANVNQAAGSIAVAGQKFHRIAFPIRFTTDGTLPDPLAINTTYFVIYQGGDTFTIATTRANALTYTRIAFTDTGAGTSYMHPYVEEDKDTRLKLTFGGNDGEDLGSYQGDIFKLHYHRSYKTLDGSVLQFGPDGYEVAAESGPINSDVLTTSVGGSETRPRNVYTNFIIKR